MDLVAEVARTISGGGRALVVRNTVERAREAAAALEAVFPGEVTLTHSRFLAKDRAAKDIGLLNRFGPPERATHRPDRHVVVATQVVEQSLDVDFDVLFTDIAPIDLVLQRVGRMHRHERIRPAAVARPRVLLTGVITATREAPTFPAGSEAVYGRWALLRSVAALAGLATLDLPRDIARLVREAYDSEAATPWPNAVDEAWSEWSAKQAAREYRARSFVLPSPDSRGRALNGWLDGSSGADETHQRAAVRDGEFNLEVVVLVRDAAGDLVIPETRQRVDSATVPSYTIAQAMAGCTLRLPVALSRGRMEAALWAVTPPAWAEAPMVCQYPLLVLDEQGHGAVGNRKVHYDRRRGLEEQRA